MVQTRFQALLLIALLLFAAVRPAYCSYDYRMDTKLSSEGQYESGVSAKFSRGVTNIIFGWTEIMRTPVRISADPRHGGFYSALVGVPLGLVRFVGRTAVGVYEIVTCLAPQPPIFEPMEGDVL
jgi:putative exosortase-associated protein (TIGR04073 family)